MKIVYESHLRIRGKNRILLKSPIVLVPQITIVNILIHFFTDEKKNNFKSFCYLPWATMRTL